MKKPAFFVGTPLEDRQETTLTGRGLLPWQQKVADERTGKRRFHGAFTGGFAAGYNNTCGSEMGWKPQQFVSSRSQRQEAKQEIEDYMDDEDLGELDMSQTLRTTSDYYAQPKENIGVRLLRLCRSLPVDDPAPFQPKTTTAGLGFTAVVQPATAIIGDEEYSFFEATSELPETSLTFVEGAVIKPPAQFKPPDLPEGYNPRHFLMNHKAAQTAPKFTSVPQRATAMAEPLFAAMLSPADIERISKIKTFVQSRDQKARYVEKTELPFGEDPNKQERYFRYVCAQEGRLVAGVGPVNLMTASQIRRENDEFKAIYDASHTAEEVPRQLPTTERTIEAWKPVKQLCESFNVPETTEEPRPQKKVERPGADIIPILQSSKQSEDLLEPAKHLALFKSIFEEEELPLKRSRGV